MANEKTYYYVLVFTNGGPVYVTSLEYPVKVAHWDKLKEPKLFTMHHADDLVFGLRCNGYQAVTVRSAVEIDYQPYRYSDYKIEWKKVEGDEE